MRITIHQPEHLPWLGFFHKIDMADVYVVLDDVQYRRRYFQNRNKIRTKDGWQWIGVPLKKENRDELLIKDAKICKEDTHWRGDNLQTIYQAYCKARYFKGLWEEFRAIYETEYELLIDLNVALIRYILRQLGIERKVVFSSHLHVEGKKGDFILNICKALGARTYVSGISGKEYLDLEQFRRNNVEVVIQEFHHPIYAQLYSSFIPCMSIIDLLFNCGQESLNIIRGIGVEVMEEVFL